MKASLMSAIESIIPRTNEQLKAIYVGDLKRWMAEKSSNVEIWKRMTIEQKQRVADIWKEGRGLYTFESCINGKRELVFPPS